MVQFLEIRTTDRKVKGSNPAPKISPNSAFVNSTLLCFENFTEKRQKIQKDESCLLQQETCDFFHRWQWSRCVTHSCTWEVRRPCWHLHQCAINDRRPWIQILLRCCRSFAVVLTGARTLTLWTSFLDRGSNFDPLDLLS